MSLNGLDTPAISEAYNAATTEAAGWYVAACLYSYKKIQL